MARKQDEGSSMSDGSDGEAHSWGIAVRWSLGAERTGLWTSVAACRLEVEDASYCSAYGSKTTDE